MIKDTSYMEKARAAYSILDYIIRNDFSEMLGTPHAEKYKSVRERIAQAKQDLQDAENTLVCLEQESRA
ncbi:MAG: hypothetical protein KKG59_03905 [Nanoarchaeota archaeon]|nr:hypothetical protein [Nanoarchaeota archaeon]